MSDADFAQLEEAMEPFKRMCLLPVTKDGEAEGVSSTLGGSTAWVGEGKWPTCAACRGPMQLLVQILTRELRDQERAVTGDGLLQLFCCLNDDNCLHASHNVASPEQRQLARVVPAPRLAMGRVVERPGANDTTAPGKLIVEWRETVDYPSAYGDPPSFMSRAQYHLFNQRAAAKYGTPEFPRPCDKVGGWPLWVQDENLESCPVCQSEMTPIVQIGSEDHLPWMWGDCGIGHIQVCARHPERAVWGWDSY